MMNAGNCESDGGRWADEQGEVGREIGRVGENDDERERNGWRGGE